MFAPKTISCGVALKKSANARRASSSIRSVSALVGYSQCVLALWW